MHMKWYAGKDVFAICSHVKYKPELVDSVTKYMIETAEQYSQLIITKFKQTESRNGRILMVDCIRWNKDQ